LTIANQWLMASLRGVEAAHFGNEFVTTFLCANGERHTSRSELTGIDAQFIKTRDAGFGTGGEGVEAEDGVASAIRRSQRYEPKRPRRREEERP
jgi:hypothetical protein